MRWKAHHFLNPSNNSTSKETFGFKSRRSAPFVKELSEFEDNMKNIIQNIQFKPNNNPNELQRKLKKDVKEIQTDQHIFVKADKTTNFYKVKPADYNDLLDKNVTKSYKKTDEKTKTCISLQDKELAESLNLDDKIETTATKTPFITLKDHKPDFINKPTCRLINPSKSEIGIVSKKILDKINKSIIQSTKVNLWRSTNETIKWFKTLQNKNEHSFITFDVCEFYPSITEKLLNKALDYGSQFTTITQQDRKIIIHAKRSLLYHNNCPWIKKNTTKMFDVTMGSYDGAETCELIGLYMLSIIKPSIKGQVGLYRDDGLIACKATPREIEKIKQKITKIFTSNDLKITIDANKKIVNFLDVTFNLSNETFKPYMKPNNKLLYVHNESNHPPSLLKNIPPNINKRLTTISSNQNVFNDTIPPYQEAINDSGYNYELKYQSTNNNKKQKTRNRKRNITWYNPPWDASVKTNLGRKFLNAVDKCFPKNHPLHKIFNRHTLKLSYSCMPNIKSIIDSHNMKIISKHNDMQTEQTTEHQNECNCRQKTTCPLKGKCLQNNVIYQATVTTNISTETYIGLATNFKERFRNHKSSFRLNKHRNATELSKHIWELKDNNKDFKITWKILKKCKPYDNISKKCNLCLNEKFFIICKKNLCSLNKRNELASPCRHRNRYTLRNLIT
jgi:hypothetical protein